MPTTRPLTDKVASASEFVAFVEVISSRFANVPNHELWFRGVKSTKHRLIASGHRWVPIFDEDSVCAEFLIHAPAHAPRPVSSEPWEILALMQHYRVPTRLLDWSRSAMMALFFAVERDDEYEDEAGKVFVLNPVALNLAAIRKDIILTSTNPRSRPYLPTRLQEMHHREQRPSRCPPVAAAIEAPLSNPRITAQRGCFTVAGTEQDSIPKVPKAIVAEIVIPAGAKVRIRKAMPSLGLTEETVYRDLESLAGRIRREYFKEAPRGPAAAALTR